MKPVVSNLIINIFEAYKSFINMVVMTNIIFSESMKYVMFCKQIHHVTL